MAMAQEASPLIDHYDLQLKPGFFPPALPFQCYQNPQYTHITLITSGKDPRYQVDNIGTQAATLQAYAAITHLEPDLVINAGTAGGFANRGAQIGTVYLSAKACVFHDRHVPIQGFAESAVGHYPVSDVTQMANALGLATGVISSGSSLEKSEKDLKVIEGFQAVGKEMEAAAIAWVCSLHQIPFIAVKSITNLLDRAGSSEAQFLLNLNLASQQLTEKMVQIVDYLQAEPGESKS